MPGEIKSGMNCGEFEALLVEAIDGLLGEQKLANFRRHAGSCSNCGPLFAEAEAGRNWLKTLVEVEPPANLVHNILAATSGVAEKHAPQVPVTPGFGERLQRWVGFMVQPLWATVRQPRFAMSFGMAFFSISIALSVAGVKVSDVKRLDLRPTAIRRNYHETSARVVKYYENIRFVYEIESRVRDLKRVASPAEPAPKETQEEAPPKNNTSGKPEERQERNYSRGESQPVLASAAGALPWAEMNRSKA
jgi:hypothetical protein